MMNLKNLIKYGFAALFLFGNALAIEDDKLLVIGCRPWDENVKGFSGLHTAHFVDFNGMGAPRPVPTTFHRFDINDQGHFSADNFSSFANTNSGKFKTIIIDWSTFQHVRRESAWADFSNLLSKDGNLICPFASIIIKTGSSNSKDRAEELKGKIINLFGQVDILGYDTLPDDNRFDLIRRPLEQGRLEEYLSYKPAILFATKTHD